jgi:hypothetical protein
LEVGRLATKKQERTDRALDDAEGSEALDDVLDLLVRDAEGGCQAARVKDLGVGVELSEEAGLHVHRRRGSGRHGDGHRR